MRKNPTKNPAKDRVRLVLTAVGVLAGIVVLVPLLAFAGVFAWFGAQQGAASFGQDLARSDMEKSQQRKYPSQEGPDLFGGTTPRAERERQTKAAAAHFRYGEPEDFDTLGSHKLERVHVTHRLATGPKRGVPYCELTVNNETDCHLVYIKVGFSNEPDERIKLSETVRVNVPPHGTGTALIDEFDPTGLKLHLLQARIPGSRDSKRTR